MERLSVPVAGFPNEKNESRDQAGHDQHPVLTFETQKGKTLDQKPHRSLPVLCRIGALFVQDKHFDNGNILFLYFAAPFTYSANPASRSVCRVWYGIVPWEGNGSVVRSARVPQQIGNDPRAESAANHFRT